MELHTDVAVIGGGVAGLTAAWQLAAAGQRVTLFEARSRLGGRVLTAAPEPLAEAPWVDLGPAWFWPHQHVIRRLVEQFGLPVVEQYHDGAAMYDAGHGQAPEAFDASAQAAPSYRIQGGMASLTGALAAAMQSAAQPVNIRLGSPVRAIKRYPDGVLVCGDEFTGTARHVVMAVPPRIVARDITWTPPLPESVQAVLANTVTWMGHAMKCVVSYDTPFWRTAGRSGYAVCWGGPLQEIHDACTPACGPHRPGYALMGFVAPRTTSAAIAFRDAAPHGRRAAVLAQLERLFGVEVRNARGYAEYDWTRDAYSCGMHDDRPPAEHPAYGHPLYEGLLDVPSWSDRLVWAGAETSTLSGGYLEGAVASGLRAASAIAALRSAP
jgi:monoamine oxidase